MDQRELEMIDPQSMSFFHPGGYRNPNSHKAQLFERVASKMAHAIRGVDIPAVKKLPDNMIPVIGCWPPELKLVIDDWTKRGRNWIYWDRGYFRRWPYAT